MAPRVGKKAAANPAPRKSSSESKKKPAVPRPSRSKQPKNSDESGVKSKDLNDLIKMVGAMQVARHRVKGEIPQVAFKHCGAQIPASLHFFLHDDQQMLKLIKESQTKCMARGKDRNCKDRSLQIACANQCEKLRKEIADDYQYLYEEQESLMSVVRSYLTGSMVRKCDRQKNQMSGNPFTLIRLYDCDVGERCMRKVLLAASFEGKVGVGDFIQDYLKNEVERKKREEEEASVSNNDGADMNADMFINEDEIEADDGNSNDAADENTPPADEEDAGVAPTGSQSKSANDVETQKRGEKRRLTRAEAREKGYKTMRMYEDRTERHVECIEMDDPDMDVRDFLELHCNRFSAPVLQQALNDLQPNEFNTTLNNFNELESILERAHANLMSQRTSNTKSGPMTGHMPGGAELIKAPAAPKPAAAPKKSLFIMNEAQKKQFHARLLEEAEFSSDDDDVQEGLTDQQRNQKLLDQQRAMLAAEEEEMESEAQVRTATPVNSDTAAAAAVQQVTPPNVDGLLDDFEMSDEEPDE